jgi:type 1 glutamine amidotransferase
VTTIKADIVKAIFSNLFVGFLLAVTPTAFTWSDNNLPRALVVTGKGQQCEPGVYPDWRHNFYNEQLRASLDDLVQITLTEDLSLLNEKQLAHYQIIINNSLFSCPTPAQFEAFFRFIEQGKGYLALHAGVASFLNSDRYGMMMGGRFLGWDHRAPLNIHTFDSWYGYDYNDQVQHPVTRNLPNFMLSDELYLVEMNTPDVEVLARAQHHPILWQRIWGKGKVMGLAIGNGDEEGKNSGYQAILRNTVRWLVGYPLIELIPKVHLPVDSTAVIHYMDLNEISHTSDGSKLSFLIKSNDNPELVTVSIDTDSQLSIQPHASAAGEANIQIQVQSENELITTQNFSVELHEPGTGNLALYHNVRVHTSSNEYRKFTTNPEKVIDGDSNSRWSSSYGDDEWIYLDLVQDYLIERVRLFWEGAYAREYRIQVSRDSEQWKDVYVERDGDGEIDEVAFNPIKARYVRMYGTRRATEWGYSLYEFEVFGSAAK